MGSQPTSGLEGFFIVDSNILILIQHFLSRYSERTGTSKVIAPDVQRSLVEYTWPGNIRELDHEIQKLCCWAKESTITHDLLKKEIREVKPIGKPREEKKQNSDFVNAGAERKKSMIKGAFLRCKGKVGETAGMLGISPSCLRKHCRRFGICKEEFKVQ